MNTEIKKSNKIEQIMGFKVENKEKNENLNEYAKFFELMLAGSPRLVFEVVDKNKGITHKRIINVEMR